VSDDYTPLIPVVWGDGTTNVPLDHLFIQTFTLNPALKNIALVLTLIGMATTILFMGLVCYWREHARIKAATRIFLGIILAAALFAYSVVIIIYVEPVNPFTCIAPHWFGHMAFFAAFGCLFAKTFRVWQIFSNAQKMKKKTVQLSDERLLIFVVVFASIGVLFLILFTILQRPVPMFRLDSASDTLQYLECQAPTNSILIALFIVEFLSLFFGVFLSFKTRKIELLKFNESSQIAISIYNLLFIGFIFIPMSYFFLGSLSPDITFLISAAGILFGTTTLVMVLFVPKFRAIINNKPDDSKRITGTGTRAKSVESRVSSVTPSDV